MQIVSVYGGLPVDCGSNGSTVSNAGSATVYYRDEYPCDATTNDGSIASSASATLTGVKYLFVAASTSATVQLTPVAAGSSNTVLTTSGAPSGGTGRDGDYAIDPSAQVIYGPKVSGVWPAGQSLVSNGELLNVPQTANFSVAGVGSANVVDITNVNGSFVMPAYPVVVEYDAPNCVPVTTFSKYIALSLVRTDAGGSGDIFAEAYTTMAPAASTITRAGVKCILRNAGDGVTTRNIAAGTTVSLKVRAWLQTASTSVTVNSSQASPGVVASLTVRRA